MRALLLSVAMLSAVAAAFAQTVTVPPIRMAMYTTSDGGGTFNPVTSASGILPVTYPPTRFVPYCTADNGATWSQCTIGGGSGGSGTVNNGSAFAPAYYPSTGTAVAAPTPFNGLGYFSTSAAPAAATAAQIGTVLAGASGCGAGQPYVPFSNTCIAAGGASAPATNTLYAGTGSVNGLQAASATTNATLGSIHTALINNTYLTDQAATSGANGLAVLAAGPCLAGCELDTPFTYSPAEFSRYFNIQFGSADQYGQMLMSGGASGTNMATENRLGNSQILSSNEQPLSPNTYYNSMSPFAFEQRVSHRYGYSDYYNNLSVRQRISGQGAANSLVGSQKGNFCSVCVDSIVRSPLQGGGQEDIVLRHTAPGDNVIQTVQADTFGHSEQEDEHNELQRVFLETTTSRWGGTLVATPTVDSAGFGNYALNTTVASGYDVLQAGEQLPLVNLSRLYTTGNYKSITTSSYNGFAKVTGDTAAGWAARYGTSTITTITASVALTFPDQTITNEAGVGGLVAQSVAVASSSGISTGATCFVGGPSSNFEIVKVTSIPDSTHVAMNLGNYHNSGEVVSCGGAVGYAWSPAADDVAPGALYNYATQPAVTLHKFWPIMGSDSSGNLLIYTNKNGADTVSTVGYLSTTPNRVAAISAVSSTGALTFSDHGDYGVYATPNLYGDGQKVLTAPTVVYSGGACTTIPTYTTSLIFSGFGNAYQYGLNAVPLVVGAGCSSPAVTIQSAWAAPYRIAPMAVTKKVIDPSNGSVASGHLLTGMLNTSNWQAGDLIEIPNWLHDATHTTRVFGKYWSGGEDPIKGIVDFTTYTGDWGSSSILAGMKNATDGYKYFSDATHPQGPGVAYEAPPDGYAFEGNFRTLIPVAFPPSKSLFDIGCGPIQGFGLVPYNPCSVGTANPFNLFALHTVAGGSEYDLSYDGLGGLSWNSTLKAKQLIGSVTTAGTPAVVVDQNAFNSTTSGAQLLFTNTGLSGAGADFQYIGKIEGNVNFSGYRTLKFGVPNTSGTYASQPELQLLPGSVIAPSLTVSSLTSGNCVQAGTGGLLTTTGSACGSGGGGGTTVSINHVTLSSGNGSATFGTAFSSGTVSCGLSDKTTPAAALPKVVTTLTTITLTGGNANDVIGFVCGVEN